MILDKKPYTLDRIVRIVIAGGLLWGLIWLLGYLSEVFIPFAVAMLLTYLINPLVLPHIWEAIKDFTTTHEVLDFFSTDNFWKISESIARKVLPGAWGLLTGTASFIMGLVGLAVIGLYLIFLLLDYEKFKQGWKNMLPPAYQEAATWPLSAIFNWP